VRDGGCYQPRAQYAKKHVSKQKKQQQRKMKMKRRRRRRRK
jgi:hypothetical protein